MNKFQLPTQEQIAKSIAQASVPLTVKVASPTNRIGPTIAIQNLSTVLSDVAVKNAVAALQIQLDRDWQPAWGTTATLIFYSRTQNIPNTYWPIYILDNSDVSGALGYHTETNTGRPLGRVFAKTAAQYGDRKSVV